MYLNQYKQNKNDSINKNNGDSSKNNKSKDGNTIIIIIIIIIVIMINSLFQPGDFSAGSIAACYNILCFKIFSKDKVLKKYHETLNLTLQVVTNRQRRHRP